MAAENTLTIRLQDDASAAAPAGKAAQSAGGMPASFAGTVSPFTQGLSQIGAGSSSLSQLLNIGQFLGKPSTAGVPSVKGVNIQHDTKALEGMPEAQLASPGFAEMLGPVGLAVGAIVLVAQKIKEKMIGAIDAVGVAGERIGSIGEKLAGNQNARAVGEVFTGMTKLAGQLPVVGEWLEHIGGSAGKVAGAFAGIVDAFVTRGREIAPFNANLMAAGVGADIRSLMADMREAQVLGPGLARLTDAQSRLENDLRELLLPLKQFIVENLADFLEWLEGALTDIDARLERAAHAVEKIAWIGGALGGVMSAALIQSISDNLHEMAEHARKAREQREREEMNNAPLDKFLDELRKIEAKFPGNHRRNAGLPDRGPNFPIIGQGNPFNIPGFAPPWIQPRPAPGN